MTYEQIITITIQTVAIFAMFEMVYLFFKRINALRKSKSCTFFVKTVYAFDRGNTHSVGNLTYFNEKDVSNYFKEHNCSDKQSIENVLQTMFSELRPLRMGRIGNVVIPNRTIVAKDVLNKMETIVFIEDNVIVSLTKFGENDTPCWFGTCVISDNKDFTKIIAKKYIKEIKNDPKSHVVRS